MCEPGTTVRGSTNVYPQSGDSYGEWGRQITGHCENLFLAFRILWVRDYSDCNCPVAHCFSILSIVKGIKHRNKLCVTSKLLVGRHRRHSDVTGATAFFRILPFGIYSNTIPLMFSLKFRQEIECACSNLVRSN